MIKYQPQIGDIRQEKISGIMYRCMKIKFAQDSQGGIYSAHAWWYPIDPKIKLAVGFWKLFPNNTWIEPEKRIEIET